MSTVIYVQPRLLMFFCVLLPCLSPLSFNLWLILAAYHFQHHVLSLRYSHFVFKSLILLTIVFTCHFMCLSISCLKFCVVLLLSYFISPSFSPASLVRALGSVFRRSIFPNKNYENISEKPVFQL